MSHDVFDVLTKDAAVPPMSIDPYAAVRGGRQRLRRRRAGVAGALTAVVAVAGLTTWSVVRVQDDPLPASSLPTGSAGPRTTTAASPPSTSGSLGVGVGDYRVLITSGNDVETTRWYSRVGEEVASVTSTPAPSSAQVIRGNGSVNRTYFGRVGAAVDGVSPVPAPGVSADHFSVSVQRLSVGMGTAFVVTGRSAQDAAALIGVTWRTTNGRTGAVLTNPAVEAALLRHANGQHTAIAWITDTQFGFGGGGRSQAFTQTGAVRVAALGQGRVGQGYAVVGWVPMNERVTLAGIRGEVSMSDIVGGRQAFIATFDSVPATGVTIIPGSLTRVTLPASDFTR